MANKDNVERVKQLLEQVARLRKLYTDEIDQQQFDSWEQELMGLGSAADVKDTPVIVQQRAKAQNTIEGINKRLLTETSEALPATVRDGLIAQRDAMEAFLTEFLDIDTQVKDIADKVQEAIDHYHRRFGEGENGAVSNAQPSAEDSLPA